MRVYLVSWYLSIMDLPSRLGLGTLQWLVDELDDSVHVKIALLWLFRRGNDHFTTFYWGSSFIYSGSIHTPHFGTWIYLFELFGQPSEVRNFFWVSLSFEGVFFNFSWAFFYVSIKNIVVFEIKKLLNIKERKL